MNNSLKPDFPNKPAAAAGQLLAGLAVTIAAAGLLALALAPVLGPSLFNELWALEKPTYVGLMLLLAACTPLALLQLTQHFLLRSRNERKARRQAAQQWVDTTQEYFDHFNHDLGRPIRRILGKERELRDLLNQQRISAPPEVHQLLDEIEAQTPVFRLMLGNMQTLIAMAAPPAEPARQAVEPSHIVGQIVLRYQKAASEQNKSLHWINELNEPIIIASDAHALEHIIANLADNALRHAQTSATIILTQEDEQIKFIVENDGPPIPEHYQPYLFDRGWTPEAARREERTSSGLGLYIARALAAAGGGALTLESPNPEGHTAFTLTLPLHIETANKES